MKVFVTGGSGYVGRPTIHALVRHGHEVTALARSDESARSVTDAGATPVSGGLADVEVLRAAAAEADGVVHLGQHYGPDTAEVDRAAAEALQDGVGAGPYVHTGGVWVYGNTAGVVDEDAPFAPPRLTAWRLDNEKRVLERAAHGGRPVVVMPGLVYGNGGGLIDAFFARPARETGAVPCVGDGSTHWAMVQVEDVADLYARALHASPGSLFAGVSGQNLLLSDVVGAVARAVGCPGRIEYLTLPQAEERMGPIAEAFALDQQLTGARAREELGWVPQHMDALAELAR